VIAYSAFDPYTFFRRGRPDDGVAYRYCGLRDERGALDIDGAFRRTEHRLRRLPEGRNKDQLRDMLRSSGILDIEPHLQAPLDLGDFAGLVEHMRSLSAGHQILLFVLTNLMATIRTGSLVLFDEPELHLHPNMLTSLMRLLHEVLQDFDSYAILATHSPQVLQEIPARSIRILERDGSVPDQRPYPRESFGASSNRRLRGASASTVASIARAR
jgi:predicted ATP-dependent endonuclease of OLD family